MSYAISGGNQKTIEAAEIILSAGGNAVDAAIAAYMVSFVSEPCMASIGASGFAMINDTTQVKLVDFFCQTPRIKKRIEDQEFFPITVDFGSTQEDFHVGKGSIAVPGAIAGIYKMHELWGRIPLKEIFEPALVWSLEGIAVDKFQAYDFLLLEKILGLNEDGQNIFFHDSGQLKVEGDIIKMPQFNDFLTALIHEGQELVYKGEISKKVSEDLYYEGHLTRADFEEYEVLINDPISFDFLENMVYTPGFPSVGGMLIAAFLNTFQDSIVHEGAKFHSLEHFQKLVNTFTQVQKLQNDPRLISDYLIHQFGINAPVRLDNKGKKWGGTTHFNVIDQDGMTVCLTTSLGEGSGYFIPGTDMQLNNMLGEEALMPNGFHNWKPDERLQSMMSPTIIVNKSGRTKMGIGSGGAGRIPYAMCQVIINHLFFGLPLEKAVEAARMHISKGKIEIESGFDIDAELFDNVNQWDTNSLYFGGTNLIYRFANSFRGVADQRRYGSVIHS